MGYKLELNPEAFARTQQGGCVMTATDTDTNIIEPLILKEGRAGGRTAINRDGLLYDVLPYEPAMSLKDGVMVLSEEPLGETLIPNSGWLGGSFPATGWASSGASALPYQSNKYSSVFKYNFINRSYMSYPVSVVSGNKYTFSCYVEDVVITDQIANVLRAMHSGVKTYYKNGLEVVLTDNVEAGNFYSIVLDSDTTQTENFRCGLGVTDSGTTSNVSVDMPQVEEGGKRTSFILSPIGVTETRLGATGVQTPVFGKWFNSQGFSIEIGVTPSLLESSATGNVISISNSNNTSDEIRLLFDNTPRAVLSIISGSVSLSPSAHSISDVNELFLARFENVGNHTLNIYIDNNLVITQAFTGFDELLFDLLKFEKPLGGFGFQAGCINHITIES